MIDPRDKGINQSETENLGNSWLGSGFNSVSSKKVLNLNYSNKFEIQTISLKWQVKLPGKDAGCLITECNKHIKIAKIVKL